MPLDEQQQQRMDRHLRDSQLAGVTESLEAARRAPEAAIVRQAESLSRRSGVPRDVVQRNLPDVQNNVQLSRLDPEELLRNSPITAQWLQRGNNAAMSKDNFEVMQSLEKSSRPTPALLPNTGRLINERADQFLGNLVEFVGVLEGDFAKTVSRLGVPVPGIKWGPDGTSFDWDVGDDFVEGNVESPLRTWGRERSNLKSGYVPNFTWENFKGDMTAPNLAGYMVEQGLPSVVEMGAALTMLPAYIVSQTQRLAEERTDAEGAGREVDTSDLAKTLPAAVASSILERFSGRGALGVLADQVPGSAVREVAEAAGREAATEFTQEHIEYIAERFGVAEMSLAEGADRGLAGAVVGSGMGATLRTGSIAVEAAVHRSERATTRELNSYMGQAQIDTVIRDIQSNTLLQESPEQMAEFLREIGPDELIYVSPEAVQEAVDTGTTVPQHMRDQLGTSQDIAIPLEKFGMDVVANEELLTALRPHLRRAPEQMSQQEIQARDGTEVRAMIARAQEQRDVATEADMIFETVTEQLVATGRLSRQSAKLSAQLVPAYVTTKVAELKERGVDTTVAEVFNAMGLRVTRGEDGGRGGFTALEDTRLVKLSSSSDLSSFLHETGHLFLESEKMFSAKYGVGPNQKAQLEILGVTDYTQIGSAEHERFAYTFEQYLRDGKAPSKGLRDAFAAFSRWLSHIYANVAKMGINMTPEVRGVFDRLLATEVETQNVLSTSPYEQYFKSKEQAGVSDAQWEAYLEKVTKRNNSTQMTLTEKVMKQYRARRTVEWREERDPIQTQEEARLSLTPEYQLVEDLKQEKMDYHAVAQVLGSDKIPPGKLLSNSKTGGQDPEVLAERYGFDSVQTMLQSIEVTPPLKKQARDNAQSKMVERYGDIFNDGTLELEVQDAAHNDAQKELLLAELRMVAKSKRANVVDRKEIAYEARRMLSSMKHTEISPEKYYRAEVRAAKAAGAAKNPQMALQAKETQLVNHYLYRESRKMKRDTDKQISYLKAAWTRKFDRSKVDGKYANALKQYSGMYNSKNTPEQRMAAAQHFYNWLRGQIAGGVQLTLKDQNILSALDESGNLGAGTMLRRFNELTASEVYSVYEMVKHLRYVGGTEATRRDAGLKEAVATVSDAIRNSGGGPLPSKDEQNSKDRIAASASHILHSLPNLRNFVRNLDADWDSVGGTVFDEVYRRLSAAENKKLATTKQFYETFSEKLGDFSTLGLDSSKLSVRQVPRSARPGDPFSLSANGRFMLAVYWGTESSREAVMKGHQVTEDEVLQMLSHLTEDQLQLVNRLWEFNESMAAPLFAAGVARDGVAPEKLPAAPFRVNGVAMSGGHMTLHYAMSAPEVRLDETSLADNMHSGLVPSKATALHSRKGSGGRMVDLNTHNVTKSIDENAHYIGYAEASVELQRILGSDDVKQAIISTRGVGFHRAFMQNLQGVTTNKVEAEMYPWLAHVITTLKTSKSAMYLMWNVKNVVQQLGSLYPAIRSAGAGDYVREATRFFGTGYSDNVAFVHERSPQMANRIAHMTRESAEAMKKSVDNTPHAQTYHKVMQSGFTPHVMLDLTISYPLWMAKYNQVLEASGDPSKAAIDADVAVNEAVGTGLDMGMGKALHSNQSAHIKLLTLFGSWFNSTVFQRAYAATKGGTDFTNKKALEALFLTPAITMMISEAIVMNHPFGDEDEGEYEGVAMWFLRNFAKFSSAAVPLFGGMISEMEGFSPNTLLQDAQALPADTIGAINDARQGRMSPAEGFESFVKIVGTVVPLPGSGNVVRGADFTESYNQGNEGGSIDALNVYQALVEGRDRNKVN